MYRKINRTDFNVEWSMLENGLDFFNNSINNLALLDEISVNNMDEDDKKILLKYSVLHLISSMEIIFKHKLLKTDWIYIFENPTDDADIHKLETGKFKSVTNDTAIKRLEKFSDVQFNKDEKKSIERLKDIRNKMEHYKVKNSYLGILLVELDVMEILMRFINEYILDEEILTEKEDYIYTCIKEQLHTLQDFIEKREKRISEENPTGNFYPCPNCGKLYFERNKKCLLCYYKPEDGSGSLQDDYFYNVLDMDSYSYIKDGGIYSLYECPECSNETLIYDVENSNLCFCYECGLKDSVDNYCFCTNCGNLMKKNDICICENCINLKMEND